MKKTNVFGAGTCPAGTHRRLRRRVDMDQSDDVPFDANTTPGSLTIPRSMLSAVSNGIYTDEIDALILSPADLSNYSGFSIVSAYGNYEIDYDGGTDYHGTWLNPFTTNTVTQGTNAGNFLLGATGELLGFRGGLITSFLFQPIHRLDEDGDTTAEESVWSETENITVDADADGTADYTFSNVQDYTDYSDVSTFNIGSGVDLGIAGASFYGNYESTINHFGGSYQYTKGLSTDTDSPDPVDVVTSKTVAFGYDADSAGAVKNNPLVSNSEWVTGIRGHLPFELADISMPIKADLYMGSDTPAIAAGYETLTSFNLTATNVTADDTTETSTIVATYGLDAVDGSFDPNANANVGGIYTGANTYTDANFQALVTAVEGDDYAYVPADSSNLNFKIGLKGLIDPEIVVNDIFSVRTRGQFGYEFDTTSQSYTGTKSVTYSEALVGQTDKAVYTWSQTNTQETGAIVNTIDLELGGIMDLHNEENTLSVACGLFYQPEFKFTGNYDKGGSTVENISYVDPANGTPDASAIGQNVGIGSVQGTQVITTPAASYGDSGKSSSETAVTNNFYIPATVKIGMANGALELIGGYLLKHNNSFTTTKTYDSTTAAATTTLTSVGGTDYSSVASTSVASNVTSGTTSSITESGVWEGSMSWMLRWNAMAGLTVDFYGATIVDALDFDILGGTTAGFNPTDFYRQPRNLCYNQS